MELGNTPSQPYIRGMDGESGSITRAVRHLATPGDGTADASAAALLYKELRRLAAPALGDADRAAGLQTTDIIHQAFERLFLRPRAMGVEVAWKDQASFYAAAAKSISDILVDEARRRLAMKRGGRVKHVSLDLVGDPFATPPGLMLGLRDELDRLSTLNARAARIVELRFFAGLSVDETAQVLGVTDRTVRRDWDIARLWLYRRLRGEHEQGAPGAPPSTTGEAHAGDGDRVQ